MAIKKIIPTSSTMSTGQHKDNAKNSDFLTPRQSPKSLPSNLQIDIQKYIKQTIIEDLVLNTIDENLAISIEQTELAIYLSSNNN